MHDYWVEFSKIAGAHLLAVASPGPDFALVLRQSLTHGRRPAIWTSVGIGTAILLHLAYALLGLGLLIRGSDTWFRVVKYAGAAYIAWLGIQALCSKPRQLGPGDDVAQVRIAPLGPGRAFGMGFLTNALNPKATLFFVSLFALVISPTTPKFLLVAYGGWMSIATTAWFCLVSVVFTRRGITEKFLRCGHWIDRALGVFFLCFAASLVLATPAS